MTYLQRSSQRALCEWKGYSQYWHVRVGDSVSSQAAWVYSDPWEGYEAIRDHLAFIASKMDACFVGEEEVVPQPGDYYGGWITSDIVGPFKGAPGSERW